MTPRLSLDRDRSVMLTTPNSPSGRQLRSIAGRLLEYVAVEIDNGSLISNIIFITTFELAKVVASSKCVLSTCTLSIWIKGNWTCSPKL